MFFGEARLCENCGRKIEGQYTHCYRCNAARKRGNWHAPEDLPMLKETDAKYKGKKFFVYVLETDYGHYVGHSGNTRARLRTHMNNEVPSTAGGHPKKIWQSQPLSTRDDAAKYEAALKSWRDNKKDEFQTHTGYVPKPFYNPNTKGRGYSPTSFSLMRFWRLSAMDIVKLVTVLLLMLYWFLR